MFVLTFSFNLLILYKKYNKIEIYIKSGGILYGK